jgi:tRNA-dihydrouridine synthase
MADIDRAGNLIAGLRKTTKKRISVKLRIGFEDDFDYLLRFCRRLEDAGLDRITLHPRTVREKFRRTARWDYVGRLKGALRIPVAGNGDVHDAAALVRRASSGLCNAVMVGRGAVRQPWIFAAARRPEAAISVNLEETALRFLDLLSSRQPPEFHNSRARRFFAYYADNLKWGGRLKNRLQQETGLSAMAGVLTDYFREHPEERQYG